LNKIRTLEAVSDKGLDERAYSEDGMIETSPRYEGIK